MANVPNPGANATSPTCSNSEDTIEVVLMSAIHSSSSEPFYDVSRLPILWTLPHLEILTKCLGSTAFGSKRTTR